MLTVWVPMTVFSYWLLLDDKLDPEPQPSVPSYKRFHSFISLNRCMTERVWFHQWLMLVTGVWQVATCYKIIALFVCTALFLLKCVDIKLKSKPRCSLQVCLIGISTSFWGNLHSKSIKIVNLYHTQWCRHQRQTITVQHHCALVAV